MREDLKALLTNPLVFPVELTLTSGDVVKIQHPDFVHYSGKLGQIFYYPPEGGGVFEMITPDQIAKIRARRKRGAKALSGKRKALSKCSKALIR